MSVTLHALLQAHFGIKTSYNENPVVSQCAITVTKLLSGNPNRLGLIVVNAGANTIYLSPKNTVAVGAGIVLVSNGGAITFKWEHDFELVTSEWFGIASGGVSNVEILEVISV